VLRGGMTPKHVDVPELLKHVKFEATIPNIITGKLVDKEKLVYFTPAPDFELSRFQITKGQSVSLVSHSAEIFLVFSGSVEVTENERTGFKRNKGEAWVCFDGATSIIKAMEDVTVYQASIPGMQ
jgi:mannose-6-phosphate isomerase